MSDEYCVMTATSITALNELVTRKMAEGWVCQGGYVPTHFGDHRQAMIRKRPDLIIFGDTK